MTPTAGTPLAWRIARHSSPTCGLASLCVMNLHHPLCWTRFPTTLSRLAVDPFPHSIHHYSHVYRRPVTHAFLLDFHLGIARWLIELISHRETLVTTARLDAPTPTSTCGNSSSTSTLSPDPRHLTIAEPRLADATLVAAVAPHPWSRDASEALRSAMHGPDEPVAGNPTISVHGKPSLLGCHPHRVQLHKLGLHQCS